MGAKFLKFVPERLPADPLLALSRRMPHFGFAPKPVM